MSSSSSGRSQRTRGRFRFHGTTPSKVQWHAELRRQCPQFLFVRSRARRPLSHPDLLLEEFPFGRGFTDQCAEPYQVALVAVADDAARLWVTWVGWGREGIILKERRAPYRPGVSTPDWLKVKHRHTVAVRADSGEPTLGRLGVGRLASP